MCDKKIKFSNEDILVTDYSSVRKAELKFDKTSLEYTFKSISDILNESALYERVHLKGVVANMSEIESATHNDKNLKYRKTAMYDNTGSIHVTFYGDLTNGVEEDMCYEITNAMVHKFKSRRFLKTTEQTEITVCENEDIDISAKIVVNDVQKEILGKVSSIDMKSFNTKLLHTNCNGAVSSTDTEDIIECTKCDHVMSSEECVSTRKLSFSFKTTQQKRNSNVTLNLKSLKSFTMCLPQKN